MLPRLAEVLVNILKFSVSVVTTLFFGLDGDVGNAGLPDKILKYVIDKYGPIIVAENIENHQYDLRTGCLVCEVNLSTTALFAS